MSVTRRALQVGGLAAGAVGAVAVAAPDTPTGRALRRTVKRASRDIRYAASTAPGFAYRLAGRHPNPNVSDDVLADRIRSSLGPVERRLDIPRVHVMVEDHVALLHGEVPDDDTAMKIAGAAFRVSGVRSVESHLHIGLIPGDTRPSDAGAHPQRSAALEALLEAARAAGATDPARAVHAVLCGLLHRIPAGERDHVLVHLPQDVRDLAGPPGTAGEEATMHVRHLSEFVGLLVADGALPATAAEPITAAVVTTLRRLVPEEAADVAAVLPAELQQLWQREVPELKAAQ